MTKKKLRRSILYQFLPKWLPLSCFPLQTQTKRFTVCQHAFYEFVLFLLDGRCADDDIVKTPTRLSEDGPHQAAEHKHLREECLVLFCSKRLCTVAFLRQPPLPILLRWERSAQVCSSTRHLLCCTSLSRWFFRLFSIDLTGTSSSINISSNTFMYFFFSF